MNLPSFSSCISIGNRFTFRFDHEISLIIGLQCFKHELISRLTWILVLYLNLRKVLYKWMKQRYRLLWTSKRQSPWNWSQWIDVSVMLMSWNADSHYWINRLFGTYICFLTCVLRTLLWFVKYLLFLENVLGNVLKLCFILYRKLLKILVIRL